MMVLCVVDAENLKTGKSTFMIKRDKTPPHAPVPDAITETERAGWTWDDEEGQGRKSVATEDLFNELPAASGAV
ncbi:hypothetical protein AVEN_84796-1 [Araneus ventricosus]|uniref:Uncharacterized protein n=1 Tax=Araneus ventricosus TaxID=182803 RepID=A0A4Y2QZS5_ARAVE|nr:hypothetical protein AVEN_189774-1 [Araneus ventricosus]GBN68841.1 hypothetical protein AVEN_190701-1 [Araneus ventricosus]GBN68875.1 hypothetical protein AVEN_72065-1 [Araneus ventricosus]GBN68877.1 hypothetical protein AVEN_84796-1 [Araneus ventricosus]